MHIEHALYRQDQRNFGETWVNVWELRSQSVLAILPVNFSGNAKEVISSYLGFTDLKIGPLRATFPPTSKDLILGVDLR